MLIRRKNTEEAREKALAKEREKRRKKMIRTKYGQAPLRHAKKGIKSCLFAGVAVFLLVLMLASSFVSRGNVSILFGFAGIATLIFAIAGLVTGIRGFKERDKNYITCKVGTGVNGLLLICMCGIFIRGLF